MTPCKTSWSEKCANSNGHQTLLVFCFLSKWGCLSEGLAPHGFLSVALERRYTSCSMEFMLSGQNPISTSLSRNNTEVLSFLDAKVHRVISEERICSEMYEAAGWTSRRSFFGCFFGFSWMDSCRFLYQRLSLAQGFLERKLKPLNYPKEPICVAIYLFFYKMYLWLKSCLNKSLNVVHCGQKFLHNLDWRTSRPRKFKGGGVFCSNSSLDFLRGVKDHGRFPEAHRTQRTLRKSCALLKALHHPNDLTSLYPQIAYLHMGMVPKIFHNAPFQARKEHQLREYLSLWHGEMPKGDYICLTDGEVII